MIIKNISGATKTFTFSNEISAAVANDAELIIPNSPEVVADALRYATMGFLEIVEGTPGAQLIQSASQPERIIIATTAVPVDDMTVVIGGVTFEWDDDDTITEGNVAVEIGTAAVSLSNLLAAVEANATLAGFTGRGVIADGTTAFAAISLPADTTAASVTVNVAGTTGFSAYKKAAEAGESLINVVLTRLVATVAEDIIFSTELAEITHVEAYVYSSAFAKIAWGGTIHFDPVAGGGLIILKNGTDPDIAIGHTIVIVAMGKA
jgi:hypothetical protein